jgi:thymidylate kinase
VTLVFDAGARARAVGTSAADALDKFERQDAMFFERVRAVYLERAQSDPQRCRLIGRYGAAADRRAGGGGDRRRL